MAATEVVTLTFGDCAENHKGMQTLGTMAKEGLSIEDLIYIAETARSAGLVYNIVNLVAPDGTNGSVLIIKNGISMFGISAHELYQEQLQFKRDDKALMYGRVVNKRARHNLCFSDFDQEPDYPQGKGTVINFSHTPLLSSIREQLSALNTSGKLTKLQCEANYYYDISKTYIGFHGDTERRIVVGLRLGATFPLHYRWYQRGIQVGDTHTMQLDGGDIYFMNSKAVGFDWKRSSIFTLRHAAGLLKHLT